MELIPRPGKGGYGRLRCCHEHISCVVFVLAFNDNFDCNKNFINEVNIQIKCTVKIELVFFSFKNELSHF